MAVPTIALLMRSDLTACGETAARLRELGFAVSGFLDACHLYAHAIGLATARAAHPASFVIVAEPVGDVIGDLEILRSGSWLTPLVLIGTQATPELARRLRATCLPCERPTGEELRAAIEAAVAAVTRQRTLAPASGPVRRRLHGATARTPLVIQAGRSR